VSKARLKNPEKYWRIQANTENSWKLANALSTIQDEDDGSSE